MVRFALVVGVAATLGLAMTRGAAAQTASAAPPASDLPALCRQAKTAFRPLTESDLEQAKAQLIQSLDRLDERLAQAGPNGEDWRKYLELAALREQLQGKTAADKAVLTRVLSRFNAGYEGLDLVWFLDVQQGLHDYLAMTGAVNNPKVRAAYEENLDKLATTLEAYVAKPTTEDAAVISESVRWLQAARAGPGTGPGDPDRISSTRTCSARSPAKWLVRALPRQSTTQARCATASSARTSTARPIRWAKSARNRRPTPPRPCSTRSSSAPPRAKTSATTAR